MGFLEKKELVALKYIGYGSDTLKKLCFELELDLDTANKILGKLEQKGYINVNGQKILLTEFGLLLASKKLLEINEMSYPPFFAYSNNFKKDIIFLPYLEIDARENSVDDYTYKLYRTEINLTDIEINVLCSLENLLHNSLYPSPWRECLFWILKASKNFCGIKVKNLIETMEKNKTKECEIKLAFSEESYVLIIHGKVKNQNLKKLSLVFYLSNYGNLSYVDVISSINNRIRPFLNFANLDSIPVGKEVVVRTIPSKVKHSNNPSFLPSVVDKILFKDEWGKRTPLIIAINPKNIKFVKVLKEVTPWFISCAGGFLNEDFKKKQRFSFRWIEHWDFPELMIVGLMVAPY